MGNVFRGLVAPDAGDDYWRWGIVTGVNPVRVHLNGDAEGVSVPCDTVCQVDVGMRVRVHVYHRTAVIMGTDSGASGKPFGKLEAAYLWKDTLHSAGVWTRIGSYGGKVTVHGGVTYADSQPGLKVPTSGIYRVWGACSMPPMGDWKRNGLGFCINGEHRGMVTIHTSMPSLWSDLQASDYLDVKAGGIVQLAAFSDFSGQEIYNQTLAVEYVAGS